MDKELAKNLLEKVSGDTKVTKIRLGDFGQQLISSCGNCSYEFKVDDSFIECPDCKYELKGAVVEVRFGGIDYFPGV